MQTSEKLFLQTIGRFVAERFKLWIASRDERIEKLEARVAELEARTESSYKYAFFDGAEYHAGNLVTDRSSLWLAKRTTTARPGGNDDWKLVVRSGQVEHSEKRSPTPSRRHPV